MTYPPPPPNPENDPTQPQQGDFTIPGIGKINLRDIARGYMEHRGIIKWGARLAGKKIPRELDEFFESVAYGMPQNVPQYSQPPQPYPNQYQYGRPPQQPDYEESFEIPQPRIGEPVLTKQLAYEAYRLHRDGMPSTKIAELFTREGNPCSHTTIVRYINSITDEMATDKILRLKTIGKYLFYISVWIGSLFIVHFLF